MSRTVLVTGASGFIGSALVRHFVDKGWHAIGAGRTRPADFPEEAQWRQYDLAWTTIPDDFFAGVDVVIHGAMVRGDIDTNVAAGKLLLDRGQHDGVSQIVYLSSLAAHEGALSTYGRHKYLLQQLYERRGALVIRPGLVIGDGGSFASMREYLGKHRLVPLFGGGNQPIQTVTIEELVDVIDFALAQCVTGTYTVAERVPVTYREFYAELARDAGSSPKFVRVPYWVAETAIGLAKAMHVRLPIDRDNILGLRAMHVDDGPRLR